MMRRHLGRLPGRLLGGLLAVTLALTGALTGALWLAPGPASAAVTVYSVPTSAAGLGRITTAPNGDMWFVEEEANKVGRITPAGVITEFAMPKSSDASQVEDVDVGADGRVWVVYDSGRFAAALNSAGQPVVGPVSLYGSPYGDYVRALPNGSAWVTLSYDEDGIIKIAPDGSRDWHDNAPPCDNQALGIGSDGAAWCTDFASIIRVNADGSGGTSYPLPSDASYPYTLAGDESAPHQPPQRSGEGHVDGPVGSIWLGRSWSGSWFTSPSHGNIGYLDAANGGTKIWNTGARTAPRSLTKAPDGTMWFTSVGAAKGIGHINATGVGALTQVGNYQPTALTIGADGAIWFTDATNNSIVRVSTAELQTTNVDPGEGSVFAPGATPDPGTPPPPAAQIAVGKVLVPKKPVRVRKGKVAVKIACPKGATCRGTAVLRAKRPVAKATAYTVAAGKSITVRFKLTRKGMRAIPKRGTTKLKVQLSRPDGGVASTSVIRVRR